MKKYKDIIEKIKRKIKHSIIFIAIASLLWVIFKSGTKPSRITYPCQKAALANVKTSFFILSIFYFPKIKHFFKHNKKYSIFMIIFSILIILIILANGLWANYQLNKDTQKYAELGSIGRSVIPHALLLSSPHRVVSIHNSNATDWIDCTSSCGYYGDNSHINQTIIDKMVDTGMKELTNTSTIADAWNTILPNYTSGEVVAIKLNFNDANGYGDSGTLIDAVPQPVNAIIRGLKSIGVEEQNIWIFDASRYITNRFRAGINYPNVRYFDHYGGATGVELATFNSTDPSAVITFNTSNYAGTHKITDVLVNADYLINMPIMKRHGGAGITLSEKNNLGSIDGFYTGDHSMHNYFYLTESSYSSIFNPIVDINNNFNIKNKTVLIIGEGLYGTWPTNNEPPRRWNSFGEDSPNMMFFSADPVAIDSVMYDYLQREGSFNAKSEDILILSAQEGLGVHERWNNNLDRQYSIIDYVEMDMNNLTCETNSNCNDGIYCNGEETCSAGFCISGVAPCAEDGYSCTLDCNENNDTCSKILQNQLCNDGNPCTNDSCIGIGGNPITGCSYLLINETCSNNEKNLVAWYKFDETSGTLASDSAGNNNGLLYGNPIWTTGHNNGALEFDGINDYIAINAFDLSSTNKVTVSFWFNPKAASFSGNDMVIELSPNMNSYADSFYINFQGLDAKVTATVKGDVGYNMWYSKTALTADTWYHIVTVLDKSLSANESKIYINGQLDGEPSKIYYADNTNNFGNRNLYIGSRGGTVEYINATVDDLKVYNRTLTPQEIQEIYLGTPPVQQYTYYQDFDNDTYGNATSTIISNLSLPPEGYVLNSLDCNDLNKNINPGAIEICTDLLDNDCDNLIDSTDSDCQICGNNIKEGAEICDGTDLNLQTCQTQGFDSGNLTCLPNCFGFNISKCISPLIPSSLIAWYKFDETSGTLASDSAGNNNGLLYGNPIWTTGHNNGALEFDGINDYVRTPEVQVNYSNGMTFTGWIYPTKTTGDNEIISHRDNVSTYVSKSNLFRIYRGNLRFGLYYGKWVYATSTQRINLNKWQFIAMTYNGTVVTFYVNENSDVKPFNYLLSDINEPFTIGKHGTSITNLFNGTMDDLKVYNRTLTRQEIQEIYLGTPPIQQCGNNITEGTEICDGNSISCTTINGYSGMRNCLNNCTGYGNCIATEFCGDRIINGREICDGSALNNKSCIILGYYSGNLLCDSGCLSFNVSQCIINPPCTILNASWNKLNITKGENVTLNLETIGNCTEEIFNYTILKNDDLLPNNIVDSFVSSANLIWNSTSIPNELNSSTYYFEVFPITNSSNKIRNNLPDLLINQIPEIISINISEKTVTITFNKPIDSLNRTDVYKIIYDYLKKLLGY